MDENLIRITPNKEKAQSMLKMVETTIEMIKTISQQRFPSNILKDYYDVVRELLSIIVLLDGYKTTGEGAHKKLIEYIEKKYKQITKGEIISIDGLRILRNKIVYDGFFITEEYLARKIPEIEQTIIKLKEIIKEKFRQTER